MFLHALPALFKASSSESPFLVRLLPCCFTYKVKLESGFLGGLILVFGRDLEFRVSVGGTEDMWSDPGTRITVETWSDVEALADVDAR